MDVMTPEQRSQCMSRIKGKNTSPEILLRKALWRKGFRYRLHAKLPGKPDISFKSERLAVFVDGCFWHGCPIHGIKPKTNRIFWTRKIQGNLARDKKVIKELRKMGWRVIRVWEHEINVNLEKVVHIIYKLINNS